MELTEGSACHSRSSLGPRPAAEVEFAACTHKTETERWHIRGAVACLQIPQPAYALTATEISKRAEE